MLALVLLLVSSGYAAGRVHAELGYRTGYRLGYRQGHADATRSRPRVGTEPAVTVRGAGPDDPESDSRQNGVAVGVSVQKVRQARG